MEDERRYSPFWIHVLAATRFYMQEEMKGKTAVGGEIPTGEFRIFIRSLANKGRCYQIAREPDGQTRVWQGPCTGDIWREMPDSILLDEKDKLGEVIIKRNHLRLKEYKTYDEFWHDIKRE